MREATLSDHLERVHQGQRGFFKYGCSQGDCMRLFRTLDQAEEHIRTVHGARKCGRCGAGFGSPGECAAHMRAAHGVAGDTGRA